MSDNLTKLWEEKSSTVQKMNLTTNEENDKCVIIGEIGNVSTRNDWSITTMKNSNKFSKQCPSCGSVMNYKWKRTLVSSLKRNLSCKSCMTDRCYTEEEEKILINNYETIGPACCVRLLVGRSYGSVRMKAKQLGLKILKIKPIDLIQNKICGCCKLEMDRSHFYNSKSRKDGKHPTCKNCSKQQSSSATRKENRKVWVKSYRNNKLKMDINYNLRRKLRKRFKSHLKAKGLRKSESVLKLLGCNIQEFRKHIESQFKSGMSWDNYGYWGWHIDHILPCASFDFTKEEDRKKCWHYTNLQPLWMRDNLRKHSKIYSPLLLHTVKCNPQ